MFTTVTHDGVRYVTDRDSMRWKPATVVAWIAAALADGWTQAAIYAGESADRAGKLTSRDGWRLMYVLRPPEEPGRPGYLSVCVYDQQGLAFAPPITYDAATLRAALRTCPECGATNVELQRVAFANPACAACATTLRAILERPGWND